ncbi:molybdenum cofactor biosynthesis protein MoaE [Methanobrevibacter sp. DSM 116169]|uniref:molybdenum cofactor biosynthesis protein MoaE n=1 Tax=Methanobrevibacter sp. DSM 116169 TaxID=3242727 RepID=UPI0038FC48D4
MVIRIIEKDEDYVKIADLIEEAKKNNRIDEAGAIFTFEGIVRGEEDNNKIKKLTLTTPDIDKSLKEIHEIVESVKTKFGVFDVSVIHYVGEFYTGDSLFLVCVLGNHRGETLDALTDVIERVKFDIDFKKEEISDNETKIIMSGG